MAYRKAPPSCIKDRLPHRIKNYLEVARHVDFPVWKQVNSYMRTPVWSRVVTRVREPVAGQVQGELR